MHINWSALADTAAVSFGITVAVVAAFALGVLSLSRREAATTATPARGGALPLAGATVCFAACAAAVAYGLTLIAS
ncbi:hypothetical protein [Kitasatospora mediocidica]|uniref:hypothetical protein n=1 Tax=Kitasatospora mediocidica TaxID=58352 RepID=UPI00055E5735|nr:hypothetical protein [Kitasatospora mediocidica]